MADKEVRELIAAIESGDFGPKGLKVVTEGKHSKIYFRDQVVHERMEGGEMGAPLTLPLTPSDPRWYENAIAKLKRSRVLTEDPKKVAQRGLTAEQQAERDAERDQREGRQEERQEEAAAQSEGAKEKQASTTLLHDRAEKLFGTMGVWKPSGMGKEGWRGTIAEVARVSLHWALARTKPEDAAPLPTEARIKDYWRRLFRNEPVVEEGRAFLNAFVDHLDRSDNPTRTYHDLLKKALGVGETRAPAAAAASSSGVEPEGEEAPVASVREVVAAVEEMGAAVSSAEIAAAVPDMNARTRTWAAWKAADKGLIQRLGRGRFAPLGYVPADGEVEPGGDVEPPEPTVEDERVDISIEPEEETHEMSAAEMESVISPVMERLEAIAQDVQRLQEGRSRDGGAPTLALECLAEMVGQHITVGAGENGGIDEDVLALVDKKRERALELAKRVAALEVG